MRTREESLKRRPQAEVGQPQAGVNAVNGNLSAGSTSPFSSLNRLRDENSRREFETKAAGRSRPAAGSLNGNLSANRTVIANTLLTGVTLAPNEYITLRWRDIDHSGNDHGLSIDDLTVNFQVLIPAIPEPSTLGLFGLSLLALAGLWRNMKS